MTTLNLTGKEAALASNAMRLAADRYEEIAHEVLTEGGEACPATRRLWEQFRRQAQESRALANKIEEA